MIRSEQPILALVPARGGSKGVPRKNARDLGGRPLLAWTLEAARGAEAGMRLVVSTDDESIAAIGREWGAEVPFLRPPELSADGSSSESVVFHALEWLDRNRGYRPELLLLLQPTSPFRSPADIDGALLLMRESGADAVVSVKPNDRPVQWLRRIDPAGMLAEAFDAGTVSRRQDAPLLYALNGAIYLITTEAFTRERTFYPKRTAAWVMPAERSLDIDTELDFRIADLVMRHGPTNDDRGAQ